MIPTAPYTAEGQDAWTCFGADPGLALAAIAGRFVGENPVRPVTWRLYHEGGMARGWDGRYRFAFPQAPADLATGDFAVAVSALYRDAAGPLPLSLTAAGPVSVYLEGRRAFDSDQTMEGTASVRNFDLVLAQGWNSLALVFQKTPVGFGGAFGVVSPYRELRFLVPSQERAGEEGWLWAFGRRNRDRAEDLMVRHGFSEAGSDRPWFPEDRWTAEQQARGLFGRLPGAMPGRAALARTVLDFASAGDRVLRITYTAPVTLWWDGWKVFETDQAGTGEVTVTGSRGTLDVESLAPADPAAPWDFTLAPVDGAVRRAPVAFQGRGIDTLILGPYPADRAGDPTQWSLETPAALAEGPGFWRADRPDRVVRPGWEAPLFAQWNYPLGVTLSGLLAWGRQSGRRDLVDYVARHVNAATAYHDLAVWEFAAFGSTNLNRQLAVLDLLDNCGSFGSLMLETAKTEPVTNLDAIQERIRRFIAVDHERLDDGSLYRAHHHVPHVVGTLWADDLYMSVPFLVRCAQRTGAPALLDDAAGQLLAFAVRLAIPGTELLSHVYDVKRSVATLVPWGRGNGWFFLSLTELLTVLPPDHPRRPGLLALFVRKAEGYRRAQTADGWWHQVLDDPTSYAETSCTAMFCAAFARGVRHGWVPETPFATAAEAGLRAILSGAVDAKGNVYGVCKGSGFAFTASYYRDSLEWVTNDTHGVGIVLLAGTEVLSMKHLDTGTPNGE